MYNIQCNQYSHAFCTKNWSSKKLFHRPQFIAVYIEEPDESGHVGGPDSTEVNSTLPVIDQVIQTFFNGLEERGIRDCVNVLLVSDHGMAKYDPSQLVHLDQVILRA